MAKELTRLYHTDDFIYNEHERMVEFMLEAFSVFGIDYKIYANPVVGVVTMKAIMEEKDG